MSQRSAKPLREALATATGLRLRPAPTSEVAGGCINECLRWESSGGPLFVKVAPAERLPMFEAEAEGLDELAVAGACRVPRALGSGMAAGRAFLALEWVDFGPTTARAESLLGEQLAMQHRVTAPRFGWRRGNTIGSTDQHNDWDPDWTNFYAEHRLRYQLDLADRNGYNGRLTDTGRKLCEHVGAFFASYRPVPSLLHGDLWGGNWAATPSGQPVLFDPAVYFGDRETDIAMTRLFGGFGPSFYAAYDGSWPLDRDASIRQTLYNLYHVLNHLNLFGGGYQAQAERMIDSLLAKCR